MYHTASSTMYHALCRHRCHPIRRVSRAGDFRGDISLESQRKTNEIRRAMRAGEDSGVIVLEIQRKYKGNPAREARRGRLWGHYIGNSKEIQRKSGARSAPGGFEWQFHWEYQGIQRTSDTCIGLHEDVPVHEGGVVHGTRPLTDHHFSGAPEMSNLKFGI